MANPHIFLARMFPEYVSSTIQDLGHETGLFHRYYYVYRWLIAYVSEWLLSLPFYFSSNNMFIRYKWCKKQNNTAAFYRDKQLIIVNKVWCVAAFG